MAREFGITQTPFFCSVVPTSRTNFSTIEEFKEDLNATNFKEFLDRSKSTCDILRDEEAKNYQTFDQVDEGTMLRQQ